MSRYLHRLLALTAAIVMIFATRAMAQTISGRISGTVVDTSGGVLPGATITVAEGTGFTRTTATDERGAYIFVNLPLGNYKVSGNTSIGSRRADYIDGVDPYVPEDQRNTLVPGSVMWLNPAAFATAPEGRRGNSTRGQFRGPSYSLWDISLRKQIPIKGSVRAMLQLDMFNAFNRVNYSAVSTSVTGSGFGSITSTTRPRQIQLGFRVNF